MYTTATPIRVDRTAEGRAVVVIAYTGNAGELPAEYSYVVDASTAPDSDYWRRIAINRLNALNNTAGVITNVNAAVGVPIDVATPLPSDVAPTAYFASVNFTPGTAPTDVFTITGASSRIIEITDLSVSTFQTTAGINAWYLVRRSTANTGGTSTLATAVPSTSSYPAASASVRYYTVNPTLGTTAGTVWNGRLIAPAPAASFTGPLSNSLLTSGTRIILTGTSQVLSLNFNAAALPTGLSVFVNIAWVER